MDKTLEHLPAEKRAELDIIREVILEKIPDVRMVILFGSYARGNWVEDTHMEDNAIHVYESDFDILVATKSKKVADDTSLHHTIEQVIDATGDIETPFTIIYHSFSYVQEMITEGHYFFTDIQKEGIYLFRTNKHRIGAIKTIPPTERKRIAQEHFDQWLEKAKDFYETFEFNLKKEKHNLAAFILHQATESLYAAICLVFINYKYKTHDIDRLYKKSRDYHNDFSTAFPRETNEEEDLFELLRKAYIDARYKKDYVITKKQLETLAGYVQTLQNLTENICKEKIQSFV